MSAHASLNAPPALRETWKQLDQGIIPEHLKNKTMSASPKKTNVAIIGYGLSAKIFHIPLILSLPEAYTLHSIVQRTPTPTDDAEKDHPSIRSHRSVDSMLADAEVDLVIVSSTPDTHYTFTKQALEAGKHVVVEKPFVPSSSEARALSKLAREKNLLLSVYQNRRWDLDFLTLKQVLDQGTLGDVVEFETHYDRFRPSLPAPPQQPGEKRSWKLETGPGHGVLYDLGSHLIDQVYALYGPPRSVTGLVQVQKWGLKMGDCAADACTVLLSYGDEEEEMLVTVKSSSISASGEQLRYWVKGTKGSFIKHHLDPQEDQLKANMATSDKQFGHEPETNYGTITTPTKETGEFTTKTYPSVKPATYVEYYRVLSKALQGDGKVPVTADEAADVLRIIEMALESSDTGRTLMW